MENFDDVLVAVVICGVIFLLLRFVKKHVPVPSRWFPWDPPTTQQRLAQDTVEFLFPEKKNGDAKPDPKSKDKLAE